MSNEKRQLCIVIDKQLSSKLHMYYTIKRIFFDEKNTTISGIVETALTEYFQNHAEETNKMMKEYHDKGGCADL